MVHKRLASGWHSTNRGFRLSLHLFPDQYQDGDLLKDTCRENIDKPVQLTVYSSKDQSTRDVTLVPSNTWGGQGLLGKTPVFSTKAPFESRCCFVITYYSRVSHDRCKHPVLLL